MLTFCSVMMNRVAPAQDEAAGDSSLPPTDEAEEGSSLPPSQEERTRSSPPPSGEAASSGAAASSSELPKTRFDCQVPRGSSCESLPNCDFSQDVADMVSIATMCNRMNVGDLVWMSWVPVRNETTRIGHGSQAILMMTAGFAIIQRAMEEQNISRGHIDLKLQEWLRIEGEAEGAQACYLYPPIGSYTQHASECDPKNFGGDKARASGFDSGENPCHGCRASGDPKHRAKYVYQERGNEWGNCEYWPFPSDEAKHNGKEYWWRSYVEPTASGDLRDRSGKGVGKPYTNPGWTQRQKRTFCLWRKAKSKRHWEDVAREPHCVCRLQYCRMKEHRTEALGERLCLSLPVGSDAAACCRRRWPARRSSRHAEQVQRPGLPRSRPHAEGLSSRG